MKLYAGGEHGLGRFRCPAGRGNCKQYAATVDSFFQDVRLPLHKAIKLMYCFTSDFSYEVTATEVSDVGEDEEVLSTDTIAAWFRYCREMIVDHVCKMQAGKPKLGGIDEGGSAIVVQIDEAKFILDGHWVLGMVDTSTNDCRMVVVQYREAATLIPLIKENVAAGSEIHTDSFRSYMGLAAEGFIHKMVNHSVEFVAPDGTHTQQIEANWRPAKDWTRGRGRFHDEEFADRLCEYLWRKFCKTHRIHLMDSLIAAIKEQYVFE
uniref:uncharacterized protein LOC117605923 n=1 Tax=Osmia lignaria TaxID=473952 RepID=UPI001478D410|nr:uncharacterized protein LOC117605923 [Osmia lignaria]XP_034183630.1 uncharacterized protein LOC117605923 [Osmia lignaria]